MANGIEIAKAYVQMMPSMDGFGKQLESGIGNINSKGIGATVGDGFSIGFGQAVFNGLANVGSEIIGFGKSAVETGKAFDSSMSQVAATMGYSLDEINTEGSEAQQTLAKLSDFAQEMGSTTMFSASQSADALNYMALAGYDAETSMNMLPTVLNLAAAGGIDLASASDMVTDAQSALGLSLEETTVMVDQMAAAASSSNTSVAQLGEAYLQIGANARNLSGGTTELSTALGILANNGIKGAEGGTHLRNILLSLQNPTDKAADAMEALGFNAYDAATGQLRPLDDILLDLNEKMDGMTDAEKTNLIGTIFNKTDLASAQALLSSVVDTTAEGIPIWDDLATSIENSANAANDMAEVQLDNLNGDITIFQSAMEGLEIALVDGITPSLREFVQFGSDGLSQLTDAFKTGGLEGAMAQLGTIISNGLNQLIASLPQALKAGADLVSTIGQGIIDNLPIIVDTAVQIASSLVQYLIQAAPQLLQAAIVLISELATGLAEQLPVLIPSMVEALITMVMALIDNIDLLIDSALVLITALADGLMIAIPELIDKAPEIIEKLVAAIVAEVPQILLCALDLMLALAGGLIDALPDLLTSIPQIIGALKDGLLEGIADFIVVGGQLIEGLWQGISDKSDWIIEKIKEFGDEVLDGLKSFFGIASPSKLMRDQVGRFIAEGVGAGIERYADDAVNSALDMSEDIVSAFDSMNTDLNNSLQSNLNVKGDVNVDNSYTIATANTNNLLAMIQTGINELNARFDNGIDIEWDDRQLGRLVKNYA